MAVTAEIQRRRFSIRDIEQMIEAGILDEDEPLELLAGELIHISPQNPRHAALTEKIRRLLESYYQAGMHTRTHSPMKAGTDSLPEPDVALIQGEVDAYLDHHPSGEDALLVVEIAATSHARDRAKAVVYSKAGAPVYWLVDLDENRVEVRSQPSHDGEYGETRIHDREARLAVPGTGQEIAVAELLV